MVGRHLSLVELFQFQGFSAGEASEIIDRVATMQSAGQRRAAPSQSSLGKMLGNTMSLNVIERVLAKALPAAGLARNLKDRWYELSEL